MGQDQAAAGAGAMKRAPTLALAALCLAGAALTAAPARAAGAGGVELDAVHIDLGDRAALQRGAKLFINYCLSCHSASYMRYNRLGRDLGISDELIKKNLLFAGSQVGDLMVTTMPAEDSQKWFGVAPPDLSLTGRARGAEWLYTYMRSFYIDHSAPSGWNNKLFENVAMPHVLYELQGVQRPVIAAEEEVMEGRLVTVEKIQRFELVRPGKLTPAEYDQAVSDLTHYMVYMAEPAQLQRYTVGFWVVVFLLLLLVPAWLLKKEYWKDVP